MSNARLILTWRDGADATVMGGKAAALARLTSAGMPVPKWFALAPAAFDASITDEQRNRMGSRTGAMADEIRPAPHVIEAIERAIRDLAPDSQGLAVRSSAVDEDGSRHSFAGQLQSYLFVPPERAIDRIAAVWRSAFSERVMAYRAERGLAGLPLPPAVLVQEMIDADVSGVAFAADPVTGSRNTVVISAVFGLGTALVGGDSDSDTFHLDHRGSPIGQHIAHKTIRHVADPGAPEGWKSEPLPAELADHATLDAGMLGKILDLVLNVSRLQKRPQDIEWAVKDGSLYLLQSRPITSLAHLPDPAGAAAIWDNSNIAESYSGITTPLTFTFARRAYEGVYREFCRIMKVPGSVIADNDAMFSQMLGLIRGRVYYNLLNWYRLLAMLPGFSVNQRFMEQMMGVREELPAEIAGAVARGTWSRRQRERLRLAWSAMGLVWNHWVLASKMRRFYARLNTSLAPPDPPLTEMRLDQLTAEFRSLESTLLTRWDAPLINDFLAMIFFGTLGKLAARWFGKDVGNLQNDLISDEGGIISTEPAKRISEMARLAMPDAELVNALCEAEPADAERRLAQMPALSASYRAYIEKFGDRCLEELKLESSTLADDATPLLRAIGQTARRLKNSPGSPGAPQPYHPRKAAEQHARAALRRRPLRHMIFFWVLRHARGRVRDRENLRFERTRLFGRVRRIFVEVGRWLQSEGLLDEHRDVFYLTLEEILAYVEGGSTLNDLSALAELRRKSFDEYRDMPAPADRFETRGAVYLGNRFEEAASARKNGEVSPTDDSLRGIGCCPGVVRGPVRIIRDPRGAHLRHGEILVAERTDPGWIMLFPAAAGILVERGSLLSHSAIVAREMGIPAVVSIPDLTRKLTDGEWVEMDGSSGVVRRIESPAGAPIAKTVVSP